jgi:hypothetical protein
MPHRAWLRLALSLTTTVPASVTAATYGGGFSACFDSVHYRCVSQTATEAFLTVGTWSDLSGNGQFYTTSPGNLTLVFHENVKAQQWLGDGFLGPVIEGQLDIVQDELPGSTRLFRLDLGPVSRPPNTTAPHLGLQKAGPFDNFVPGAPGTAVTGSNMAAASDGAGGNTLNIAGADSGFADHAYQENLAARLAGSDYTIPGETLVEGSPAYIGSLFTVPNDASFWLDFLWESKGEGDEFEVIFDDETVWTSFGGGWDVGVPYRAFIDLTGHANEKGLLTIYLNSTGSADSQLFLPNFARSLPVGRSGDAVPEPSTWAMIMLGFVGLGIVIRRQRRDVFRSANFA